MTAASAGETRLPRIGPDDERDSPLESAGFEPSRAKSSIVPSSASAGGHPHRERLGNLKREATTMTLRPRRTSYQQLGLAVLGLTTFALGVPAAWAQIAVSANDNKIVNVDGTNQIVENPRPDT